MGRWIKPLTFTYYWQVMQNNTGEKASFSVRLQSFVTSISVRALPSYPICLKCIYRRPYSNEWSSMEKNAPNWREGSRSVNQTQGGRTFPALNHAQIRQMSLNYLPKQVSAYWPQSTEAESLNCCTKCLCFWYALVKEQRLMFTY